MVADALAGAGLHRGAQLPVRRRRAGRPARCCPPTTTGASAVRLANPLSEERPLHAHDRCSRASSTCCGATSRAATRTSPSSRSAWSSVPAARSARRRIPRVSARAPTTDARAALCRRPGQPRRAGRRRDRPDRAGRVVGSGSRRRLERHGGGRAGGRRGARRARRRRRTTPTTRRGTRVGARGSRSPTAPSSGTPASCTPRCSPPWTCLRARWRPSSTSTCSRRRARRRSRRAVLDLPARPDRHRTARALRRRSGDIEAALRSRGGRRRSSRRCSSTSTRGSGSRRGTGRSAYRLTFRAADRTLTTDEVNALPRRRGGRRRRRDGGGPALTVRGRLRASLQKYA